MDTANFATVIETLFYILLFYYIFKFVMRLLLPVAVKKVVEKAHDDLNRRYAPPPGKTGETTYDAPSGQRQEKKKVGEYIDFEEIE